MGMGMVNCDGDGDGGVLLIGYVKTGMTGNRGNISAGESAAQLLERIDALSMDNSGTFWHANGEILPW